MYPYFRMWEEPEDFLEPPAVVASIDSYSRLMLTEFTSTISPVSLYTDAVYTDVVHHPTFRTVFSFGVDSTVQPNEDRSFDPVFTLTNEQFTSSILYDVTTPAPATDVTNKDLDEYILIAAAVGASAALLLVLLFCCFICFK